MYDELELEVADHNGKLQLVWHRGCQRLVCLPTGEQQSLQPKAHEWQLSAVAGGQLFLHSDGEVVWAVDKLEQPICEDIAGGHCVVHGATQVALDDFLAERVPMFEATLALAHGGRLTLCVFGWRRPRFGAKFWWGVLPLFKGLGLKSHKGHASRWADHGWDRWQKLAETEFRLQPGALLRRVSSKASHCEDAGDMVHGSRVGIGLGAPPPPPGLQTMIIASWGG